MHSSILYYVVHYAFDWIVNYQFPWDSGSWCILDYITFCCIVFVILYFVFHIIFFIFRQYERYLGFNL